MTMLRSPHGTPVVGIVGWKNSGKTTLVERLIEEFTRRGLRVASVKHAHHSFEIDDTATDSARHRRAGSAQVAIVSNKRWALITETAGSTEPDFADVVAMLAPADLIIVEGYKRAPIPKIEARRGASANDKPLAPDDSHIIAIATDEPSAHVSPLPIFHLDDITSMTNFLTTRLELPASK